MKIRHATRVWRLAGEEIVRAAAAAVWGFLALPGPGLAAQPAPQPAEPPAALPARISQEDAVRLFRQQGFDLLLADAAVAGARGDLAVAKAFPNPQVGGGGGHSWNYDRRRCDAPSDCSPTAWNANLSDEGLVFDLLIGKRRLKVDVAKAALEAARLSRADAERTLVALVEQQYSQTVLAGATLGFAREVAKTAAETSRLVDLRFRAGDVSEADSARAATQKLEAEQAVDAAAQGLAAAKTALAFLLGARDGHVDFEVDPQLPAARPGLLSGANTDTLLAEARSKRPDLAAAESQLRSAEASLALARRQRLPDVALVANYQQQGTGQEAIQPPTATFGLSLPLPVFYQNQGEIAKAEAAVRAQALQRAKLDAQVASDVASGLAAFQSAAARVQRMDSGLLEHARRARDLVEYQYKRGAASLLELLDAQRTFVATNAEYYQDVGDYWSAFYQLEAAVGAELGP